MAVAQTDEDPEDNPFVDPFRGAKRELTEEDLDDPFLLRRLEAAWKERQLDEQARRLRPSWQDLVNEGFPGRNVPRPVEPPMAVEGVEDGTPQPAPAEMSEEDIKAQAERHLATIREEDTEDKFHRMRRELARQIEEKLFTPSAAPVEGGQMQPLIPQEVADFAGRLPLSFPGAHRGVQEELAQQAREFSRPDTLLSLPMFALPGVTQAFAASQVAQLPEKVQRIKDVIAQHGAWSKETGRGVTREALMPILSVLGVKGGHGVRAPIRSAEVPGKPTMFDVVRDANFVRPQGPRPTPDLTTFGPPMPQRPGTIAGDVSRALQERRAVMVKEPRPPLDVAPTVEETLARTEQPSPEAKKATADLTRQILDRRKVLQAEANRLHKEAEVSRRINQRVHPDLEKRIAEINAEMNQPNVGQPEAPVYEPTERTGAKTETQRIAEAIQQRRTPSVAENISRVREERRADLPEIPEKDKPYAGPPSTPTSPAACPPVKPGLVDTLATKAAEARARIEGRRGRMNSEAALFANIADEAVIGAYHIVRLGRDFGKWVAAMTKELGERSPLYWRQLYDKSLTQLKEEGQKTEFLKQKAKESRSRLDLSKEENFGVVDQAIPIGEVARNEEFLLIDSNGEAHRGMVDRKLNVNPELFDISPPQKQQYRRPSNLLGTGIDPKTVKGEKFNVRTFIMYLAAHVQAGIRDATGKLVNICKFATKDCAGGCLGKGGMGTFDSTKIARANKTKFFHYDKPVFNMQLHKQITREKAKAQADGKQFAVRLNGTSDVLWEQEKISGKNLMELHPDVQFYDYTKYPATSRKNLPDNYHMTYSYTGLPGSDAFSLTWAERGVNTAVVFGNGMPAEFLGRPVIDGDVSDLRFRDPKGVIVGLHAKGPLLKLIGQSDFIYDTPPEDVAIPYIDPRTKARLMKNDMLGEDAVDSIKDAAPAADKLKYKRGNPFLGENVKTESLAPVAPRDRGRFTEEHGPVKGAAVQMPDGRDFVGPTHSHAAEAAIKVGYTEEQVLSDGIPGWKLLDDSFKPTGEESLFKAVENGGIIERKAGRARINRAEKIRQGRQLSGLDPSDLTDLAWILADHINRNGTDRFAFEDAAMKEAGPAVAQHLDALYKEAMSLADKYKNAPPPLVGDPKAVSDQPHIASIANRFVDERVAMGELGKVETLKGKTPDELRAIGLKMQPEEVTQAISDMMHGGDADLRQSAAVIGEEARLSHRSAELSRIAQADPTNLEAKRAADEAFKDVTDFHNGPVAVMKHKWHTQGEMMQGEHVIDVSTLNGQKEAWLKDTGKPPPASAEPKLQKAADRLARAVKEENGEAAKLTKQVDDVTRRQKLPNHEEVRSSLAERLKEMPCK